MHNVEPLVDENEEIVAYQFWCPACASIDIKKGLHVFHIAGEDAWDFDGHQSFNPSLAYESHPYCHLHFTDGQIRYYGDSHHPLAGQVISSVPIPPGDHEERN